MGLELLPPSSTRIQAAVGVHRRGRALAESSRLGTTRRDSNRSVTTRHEKNALRSYEIAGRDEFFIIESRSDNLELRVTI